MHLSILTYRLVRQGSSCRLLGPTATERRVGAFLFPKGCEVEGRKSGLDGHRSHLDMKPLAKPLLPSRETIIRIRRTKAGKRPATAAGRRVFVAPKMRDSPTWRPLSSPKPPPLRPPGGSTSSILSHYSSLPLTIRILQSHASF